MSREDDKKFSVCLLSQLSEFHLILLSPRTRCEQSCPLIIETLTPVIDLEALYATWWLFLSLSFRQQLFIPPPPLHPRYQSSQLRELSDSDRAFLAELARAEALSLETARWDEIRRQTLRAGHHLGGQPAGKEI